MDLKFCVCRTFPNPATLLTLQQYKLNIGGFAFSRGYCNSLLLLSVFRFHKLFRGLQRKQQNIPFKEFCLKCKRILPLQRLRGPTGKDQILTSFYEKTCRFIDETQTTNNNNTALKKCIVNECFCKKTTDVTKRIWKPLETSHYNALRPSRSN